MFFWNYLLFPTLQELQSKPQINVKKICYVSEKFQRTEVLTNIRPFISKDVEELLFFYEVERAAAGDV